MNIYDCFMYFDEDLILELKNLIGAGHPILQAAAEHLFSAGGKRLRPGIVLLISKAISPEFCLSTKHKRLAEITEMIHTASLVHDDVVDEASTRRGVDTMRYGPLKSIGLWNPKWGDLFDRENRLKKRPHAVVQFRKEDLEVKLLNMVGFQTNLKWSEQKRIFRMIPGLEKAEFVRFGVMHRNTFLESPKLLLPTLQFLKKIKVKLISKSF